MKKVQSSVLYREIAKLRNDFDCNRVEFFTVGDGIDTPIHVMVGSRGHGTVETDEAIEEGKALIEAGKSLIEAGKAAKEFVYNGYFIDWGEYTWQKF